MRIVIETDEGQSVRLQPESPTPTDEIVTTPVSPPTQDESYDGGSAPTAPPQSSRPDDTRPPTDAISAGEGPGSIDSDTLSPPSVAVEQLATAMSQIDSGAASDAESAGPAPSFQD